MQRILNKTGKNGTYDRIKNFNIRGVYPELAARAKQLISEIDANGLKRKSANTAAIYEWYVPVMGRTSVKFSLVNILILKS